MIGIFPRCIHGGVMRLKHSSVRIESQESTEQCGSARYIMTPIRGDRHLNYPGLLTLARFVRSS